MAAVETDVVQGGTLIVDGSAVGKATELGQFAMTYHVTVDLGTGGSVGTATFVAANGDTIDTTASGESAPTSTPGVFRIVEIQTITGGTGRFANAKGTFTVVRLTDLNTGFTSGSFSGIITSPGSAK